MLAVLAARGNGPGIGIAQPRMLVLTGKASSLSNCTMSSVA